MEAPLSSNGEAGRCKADLTNEGSGAEVYAYGSHATGWTSKDGVQRLYMSSKAEHQDGKALRGGMPICWPQFNSWGPLSCKHGFVRANGNWQLAGGTQTASGEHNSIAFKITDDEASNKLFPNRFELIVTHSIEDDALHTNVAVKNNNPFGFSFSFQFLLHTYLAVPDIEAISIKGLQGTKYMDGLRDRQVFPEEEELLGIHSETDRVYMSTGALDLQYGDGSSLQITKEGLADTVVWNPWDTPPGDVGEGEWRKFVCIESGQVENAVTLAAGETWTASQQMRVVPAAAL